MPKILRINQNKSLIIVSVDKLAKEKKIQTFFPYYT